jgi:hypothetical protein
MFTVRNTLVVAIMQVGVIVAGTLASGLCHRLFAGTNIPMPWPAALLYSYGIVGFSIPLSWATVALLVERRTKVSDDLKMLVFLSGIAILILLVFFVIDADVGPWLHGTWSLAGDGDKE